MHLFFSFGFLDKRISYCKPYNHSIEEDCSDCAMNNTTGERKPRIGFSQNNPQRIKHDDCIQHEHEKTGQTMAQSRLLNQRFE